MGYEVPRGAALLKFEGTKYDGAEVRCHFDVDFNTYFALQRLADDRNEDGMRAALNRLGDEIIIEWNLTNKGEPIPVSGESLLAQPVMFGTMLIKAWLNAMTEPPAPLESASPAGVTSAAQP